MQLPKWYKRIDQAFGFHEDERTQLVHGSAVRTAYSVMAVATVPFGMFQEFALGQRGAVWITLAILLASLVVLVVRRVQLNGFGAADERMVRARHSMFLWPVFTLLVGMVVYATYLLLTGGDGRSIMALALYNMLGPLVIILSRSLSGTMQGHAWYWLGCGVFTLGLLGWNMWTIGPVMSTQQQLGASGPSAVAMLVGFASALMLVFGVLCLVTAWRRWQEQRIERDG